MAAPRPPLVLLTGFLGAGKTTVLNRVLGADTRRRIAVIVNELGRIDVDARLLKSRSGAVMELAGGCVCHEIRTQEELWQALEEIVTRWKPEVIVLETTGIAEPAPILAGLAQQREDERLVDAGAVVTVVDGEAGLDELDRYAEARAQVEAADRLLLSKLDVAPAERAAALHARLAELNPRAERASFPPTNDGTLELVPWLFAPRAAEAPARRASPHHHHHRQLVAAAHADDVPLLREPLLALVASLGPALVRAKGFVDLAGEDRRAFLERAGARTELRLEDPWPPGPRRTEIVLIGEGLDPVAIKRQLWACRSGTSRAASGPPST